MVFVWSPPLFDMEPPKLTRTKRQAARMQQCLMAIDCIAAELPICGASPSSSLHKLIRPLAHDSSTSTSRPLKRWVLPSPHLEQLQQCVDGCRHSLNLSLLNLARRSPRPSDHRSHRPFPPHPRLVKSYRWQLSQACRNY